MWIPGFLMMSPFVSGSLKLGNQVLRSQCSRQMQSAEKKGNSGHLSDSM
ncbi:hypothetical protein V6Z11_D09G085600 [Gossypium hirsutum]